MPHKNYLSATTIQDTRKKISSYIKPTPIIKLDCPSLPKLLGKGTEVYCKLELLQHGGSFKSRGAINNLLSLSKEQLKRGVVAVSAGNHGIAVSYAASVVGTSAKIIMPQTANRSRVERCISYGAEVILLPDMHTAFDKVKEVETSENRFFVHPFDSEQTIQGTATLGAEIVEELKDFDAIVIPIGGGGLASGVSHVVRERLPLAKIYGVEPEGANTMFLSFQQGKPSSIPKITTIADSLGPPAAGVLNYEECKKNLDDLVLVSDNQIKAAMYFLFSELKLVAEPAAAASTAATLGPLKEKLKGKKIVLIICGTNIDTQSYSNYLLEGEKLYSDSL
ncbi:MAG: threonine/serine dehydratase [Proteobacteria bacterium]|nr:threonine/serine dehydratase [Pseudomonadota bacterium]